MSKENDAAMAGAASHSSSAQKILGEASQQNNIDEGSVASPLATSTSLTISVGDIPATITEPLFVTYRSVGIGIFGVGMRFVGMPLEKMALFLNSSQINTTAAPHHHPFRQAWQLVFREGYLAPYRVVGPASLVAWFFQYSVMGFAFQFFDRTLSQMLHVKPLVYGAQLMEDPCSSQLKPTATAYPDEHTMPYQLKSSFKMILTPVLSAALETMVSNRAEAQRYFGRDKFLAIEQGIQRSAMSKTLGAGMAFTPCFLRNQIMCQTTFLLTPMTYRLYFPQEHKNPSTLFWFGLGMNVFVGNAVAITQQALWGRSLDYLAAQHAQQKPLRIEYSQVVRQGLASEGLRAFFTTPKWFSRVMMNAPVQGVLPWFYNEILPMGEPLVLSGFKMLVYEPIWTVATAASSDTTPRTSTLRLRATTASIGGGGRGGDDRSERMVSPSSGLTATSRCIDMTSIPPPCCTPTMSNDER